MSDCDCGIEHREVALEYGQVGDRWQAHIVYCPLHHAADEMREVLGLWLEGLTNPNTRDHAMSRTRAILSEIAPA